MNVGSLFSGIGGMDHGLAAAGFTHRFFCESDSWRRTVLEHHWPGVPIYEDVRDVGGGLVARDDGAGELPATGEQGGQRERQEALRVDLLCGGFPCQDLSVAGQRRGLAGERSGLFHEFVRIINLVRPRWVLIENVPGLLSSNGGRDFGTVLGTLADIGYGTAWRCNDSRFFGVPQRRRRVFIVGAVADGDFAAAERSAGAVLAVGTRCPGHPPAGTKTGPDVAVASLSGLGTGGPDDNDGQAGRVIAFSHTQGLDEQASTEAWLSIRKGGSGHAVAVSENQRAEVLETPYAHQLTSGGGEPGQGYPMTRQGHAVRRLTPVECERLQALPDNWTNLGPDSRRYAALGDAVTSSVAEWIGRRMILAVAA